MRLVKISLGRETPFWFLGPISLNEKKKESDYIDVDALKEEDKKVINESVKRYSIRLWDVSGRRVNSVDEAVLNITNFPIDTSDVEPEENLLPELISVTVSEVVQPTLPVSLEGPTETDVKDAKILIERKGNTIKKIIGEMVPDKRNMMVLMAAIDLEQADKNREGILRFIRETIERWQDGRNS